MQTSHLFLMKLTAFKGKQVFMREVLMLAFLSGDMSGKHEVVSGGKPEQKETACFHLAVHSAFLLIHFLFQIGHIYL